MSIFDRIDTLRQQEGLSFNEFEKRCGLARQTVEKWRLRCAPSASALTKISLHFGISVDYLLGLSDNPHPCTCCITQSED